MGTKWPVTKRNLYGYWTKLVTKELNNTMKEMGTDTLINLASIEYFKVVDKKTLKDTEVLLIEFRRKVDNLLTPKEIREIRTSFGYTQEEFGKILGGGKKAFARYENGTITQSRAMDNQLKMIKSNPENLAIIEENPQQQGMAII